MVKTAGWIWDERFLDHDPGKIQYTFPNGQTAVICDEFENKNRMLVIKNIIEKSGINEYLKSYKPDYATDKDLLRVHTKEYIERLISACESDVREVGPEAYASKETEKVSRLSSGAAIQAVDITMSDPDIRKVYAQVRPPGHHASSDQAMGFCFYNNVAVAAAYAIEQYHLNRVLILDWDVHHGNGTQDIFYGRKDVLVMSIHEEDYFPLYTGQIEEVGEGDGFGYNINIPVPPLTGDEGYKKIFDMIVTPVIEQYKPELILVSAGQDANPLDPIARLMVTREGYRQMAQTLRELSDKHCMGRLAIIQEGGYNLAYLPIATLGVLEGLLDINIDWEDPHLLPKRDLPGNFKEQIDRIIFTQSNFWDLKQFCSSTIK